MSSSRIWTGIGAFALAMMATVGIDPSNGNVASSKLSIGGAPAIAQGHRGPEIPSILETLEDLGALDEDDDDEGPDDDGPGLDDDDDDDDSPVKSR